MDYLTRKEKETGPPTRLYLSSPVRTVIIMTNDLVENNDGNDMSGSY